MEALLWGLCEAPLLKGLCEVRRGITNLGNNMSPKAFSLVV